MTQLKLLQRIVVKIGVKVKPKFNSENATI